ncbi:carbohydrate kinase family protein [Streptomyces sp. TLI_171]|uniref:carbohydrate kinase family protein n=1 Tax=Streptomyces sp. TLI_171 TaxID=1938859 RepID=UPI000C19BC96|nr:PfkB family carbohydrate kinase [Streptomyces sp. TLI_171]RKE18697.1 sugar/nucleoside kinase (ribokinase family) [Streptomyces sp. TLI_171]
MIDYDILIVGGVGVDTIVRVDRLEVPTGRDSVGVPPVLDYPAHTGNGVALACHALGLRTKFADFLGQDPQGDLVLAEYARRGLDFSHLPAPAGTPRSVNLVDAEGLRFSFYDGRHPADARLPREFWLPLLERSAHVHLSITNVNRDMYPDIERLGRSSSTDLHAWDGVNEHHRHYALRSDLVFLSAAGLDNRPEAAMRAILDQGRAELVVATAGAHGSFLLTREDAAPRHFPTVDPGAPIVDSNGAGDAFVSGFLSRRLAGRPVEECMRAGAAAGAFACTTAGTHTAFLDAAGLEAALSS